MTKPAATRPVSRRTFGAGLAVTAAAVSTSGWIRGARAAEKLKLGVLLPRSGYLALIGQACQRGFDVAVPVLKEMGYDLELMNADIESSPDVARTQAEKLIREGAHILCGAFESGATAAIAQVCEQKGVPFVINIGADPKITEQGYRYTVRNFPTSVMLGTNGLQLVKDLLAATDTHPKTAVLMIVNDTFGQSMLTGIKALAPKVGLPFEIAEIISYDPKARDLSVEVAKAKSVKADLHMVVCRLNDAILMVREMVKQKYEPMGIVSPGSPGMYERQFLKTLGKYADYCCTNVPWFDPKQALAGTLEKAFEKAYPEENFDLNIGFSFEGALIAADAYKRAGSTAPDAIMEALRKTSLEKRVMIGGPIRFNEKGQNADLISAVVQNRDGKPTVVLPAANAAMKPVFPMPGWASRT
jgi:branched-chain amino acid transport system substrate-binding protein